MSSSKLATVGRDTFKGTAEGLKEKTRRLKTNLNLIGET